MFSLEWALDVMVRWPVCLVGRLMFISGKHAIQYSVMTFCLYSCSGRYVIDFSVEFLQLKLW